MIIEGPEPRVLVPSDGPFTFGRGTDCSLTLDGTDRSISRLAGSIGWDGERWVLRNESNSRPLYCITEPGLRRLLATGEVLPLSPGRLRVQVTGVRTHELSLVVEGADEAARPDSNAEESKSVLEATMPLSVTANERVAILALAEGYLLDHPRYDPRPRTYADAATRVALPESTIRKRIENVRRKLVKAGVVQLETGDARAQMIEFLLATRVIGKADLPLLERRAGEGSLVV